MEIIKTKAIILGKTKYGEADLILKLIGSDGQVFSAIAKSALKSKKRFGGGVLEPSHYINATLSKADVESERLSVLTEASLIDGFVKLREDYDRLTTGFQFVRWVATFGREGDASRELFDLLGHALKACETVSDLRLLRLVFQLKLLQMQGVLAPDPLYVPFLKRSVRDDSVLNLPSDTGLLSLEDIDATLSFVQAKADSVFQQYAGQL